MQITSIEKRFGFWHVDYEDNGTVGGWIYSDIYEVFRLLIDSGFHMSGVSYEFPEQSEFSENVTMVRNKMPVALPRGYRDPSPIDEYEVDIETVMGEIETFYKGRSLG
jgi:hypothetical protein